MSTAVCWFSVGFVDFLLVFKDSTFDRMRVS